MLNIELEEHTKGDHQYHIHVANVVSLCRRMAVVLNNSEPLQKRALLQFLLQNVSASRKKLEFTLKKPFDAVLELADCPTGLGDMDKFRTPEWRVVLNYQPFSDYSHSLV